MVFAQSGVPNPVNIMDGNRVRDSVIPLNIIPLLLLNKYQNHWFPQDWKISDNSEHHISCLLSILQRLIMILMIKSNMNELTI